MRLIRWGQPGREKPGILTPDGTRLDVSALLRDYDRSFFATDGVNALAAILDTDPCLPEVDPSERWAAPIARPGALIAIGLNYSDHAAESGMAEPDEPVVFTKPTNTVVGPYDHVIIPRGSTATDYEVELAVIIGSESSYLDSEAEALTHVAGYCVADDVSERDFQLHRGGQWCKGKGSRNFCPLGPWLRTADEVDDPQQLELDLMVNGEVRQRGHTGRMIFGVAHIVWYLSQFMVLEPGDVILTGTPPGVGMGFDPPKYLQPGDIVELGISGLGRQRSEVVPSP